MRPRPSWLWMIGLIALATPSAVSKPAPKDPGNAIVIYFKDGHQQSIALADIARIEFKAPEAAASASELGHFVGQWKVGNGMGGTFLITLRRDGSASKTLGSAHGNWEVVNGAARITWDDGWRDVIRRSGKKYQKAAYAPGRSLSDDPSNVAEAEPMEPI